MVGAGSSNKAKRANSVNKLSRGTRIYISGTILGGVLLYAWWIPQLVVPLPWLLVLAAALASLLQVLSVFGSTARSSYSLSWIVYGFALVTMGPAAALVVILVAHVVEWLSKPQRLTWYVQLFNVGTFAVATTVATPFFSAGQQEAIVTDSASWLVLVLIGMGVFTIVNHLMIGWVIRMARGQSLAESGVFGVFTLILDFALLCLGLLGALIWEVNPLGMVVVGLIAYLLYESLKIPALERRAETDAKTGLFDASYFNRALEEELARALRFERPLTVVMGDLDLLRNINNTYGHLAGDVVLQGIAGKLQEAVGEYEVAARFGGEEFSLLLPETSTAEAFVRVELIRQAVAACEFTVMTSVEPIQATMSFGLATLVGEELTAEQLLDRADKALYEAKRDGRNRVRVFKHNQTGPRTVVAEPGSPLAAEPEPDPFEEEAAEPAPAATANGTGHQSSPPASPEHHHVEERKPLPASPTEPGWSIPAWAADLLIISLIAVDVVLAYFLLRDGTGVYQDWTGLVYFAILGLLVEYVAVEIYVRDTTVSTSAAVLISGVLLFGPLGALALGPIIAIAAYFNHNQRLQALTFNSSNHIFAGLLVTALLEVTGLLPVERSLAPILLYGAIGGFLVFLSTTLLLTAVITLASAGSFHHIWRERFRWLAVYYVVLGLAAAGLVFSYLEAGPPGVLVVAAPLFMLRYSQKQYLDHTASMVGKLREANEELVRQADEIAELNEDLLLTLARSVDLRDPYVMEHSKHVARYAVHVARALDLPPERVEIVRKAGLLHDIGKLGIPDDILFKPDRLTFEEYETMKQHVQIGADLIHGCHSLHGLIPIVRHHHEWYDGGGYPDGLAGDEVMLEARILALADAVEAMASDRPYHDAMTPAEIADEIERCAGSQFDPRVVEAFAEIVREEGDVFIVNSARAARNREINGESIYLTQPPHV